MKTAVTLPSVDAIIPTWNGGDRVETCVGSLMREMRAAQSAKAVGDWRVVVVDDASPDGSDLPRLKAAFAEEESNGKLVLIQRETNGGFGRAITTGVAAARADLLLLINNDLVPQRDFVEELVAPFALPDALKLGAVSARTESLHGERNHVAMSGEWRGGRIHLSWDDPDPSSARPKLLADLTPADFFQGGAAAVRRSAWDALVGLDPLFDPGYWEDYDLAARMIAAGWVIAHAPRARAFHVGKSSMSRRFSPGGVRDLMEAHRLLYERRHRPKGFAARCRWSLGVGRDVLAEWWRGGPFHQTRALMKAWRTARGGATSRQ